MPKDLRRLKTLAATMIVAAVLLTACGCAGVRVLITDPTEPVQLAEPVRAHVFIERKDGTRVRSNNRVTLPAGAWVATLPDEPAK